MTQPPTIGVLLIHGLNGDKSDMAELTAYLAANGMIAENMLLPGHGTRQMRDLLGMTWAEWSEAVSRELRSLKQRCDVVFLVGHSLGGALALHVAAHEEIAGIVTMCAPLHMHPLMKPMVWLTKYVTPMLPSLPEDVRDTTARRNGVRWTPMRPVESMLQFLPQLRTELPDITIPALVMTSIHDHVVPARDGREIYRLLGSRDKHLVTFHRSYHVIMKDHDREEVFSKTYAFIRRHASKATPHRRADQQTA